MTVLVTGATDGHGRVLAEQLAGSGATILLHGRSTERGEQAVAEISERTGNDRLRWYRADLSDLDEVRRLAAEVGQREARLDVLVNNAGIGTTVPGGGVRQESAQGYELRFAVNYLAGFCLTRLLYPLLRETATSGEPARVVNVSSAGQAPIDFDDVMLTASYDPVRAYCQSKLAQIMMTFDDAARWPETRVAATALHPSTYMPTKIVASPMSRTEDGARATARLVHGLDAEAVNGRYFNVEREARADSQAYDDKARAQLRELSEQLCGF